MTEEELVAIEARRRWPYVNDIPDLIAALREAWEREHLMFASAVPVALRANEAEAERGTALADLALSRFENGQMLEALVDVCAERDAAIARAEAAETNALGLMENLTDAEAERDALRAEVATLREALEGLLGHSGLDVDAKDKDAEDHAIERAARAALATKPEDTPFGTVALLEEAIAKHNPHEKLLGTGPAPSEARAPEGWREALEQSESAFESIRLDLIHNLKEPERASFWKAVSLRDKLRALLSAPLPPAPTEGGE